SRLSELAAAGTQLAPDGYAGGAGAGGSPLVFTHFSGGSKSAASLQSFGRVMTTFASLAGTAGSISATMGGYQRRADDWGLQKQLAIKEIEQVDKQIAAAEIRCAIAEIELNNHNLQVENAKEVEAFMRDKYTNQELYDWMVGQISSIYFQSYQMAYDIAKRVERT